VRVLAEGNTLHLRQVQEEDAGTYILRAENVVGAGRRGVRLVVQHPPRITSISPAQLASEGDTVVLSCSVAAVPLTIGSVWWQRRDYSIAARGRVQTTNNGSTLTITNVTAQDAGRFECVANNGVPSIRPLEVKGAVYLLVHQRPSILALPSLVKAAASPGSQGSLRCRARAAPNVTFTWRRAGGRLHHLGAGATVEQHQVDPLTWESELHLGRVEEASFGSYLCLAANQWGEVEQEVTLGLPSRPDPPTHLAVTSATYNSVELSWRPGFSGGFPQYFRVRLQRPATTSYLFVDVFPHNASAFTVPELAMDTAYSFAVMAFNKLGESGYSGEVRGATAKGGKSQPLVPTPGPPGAQAGAAGGLLATVATVGGVLFICNLCLLYCYVKRRAGKQLLGTYTPPPQAPRRPARATPSYSPCWRSAARSPPSSSSPCPLPASSCSA